MQKQILNRFFIKYFRKRNFKIVIKRKKRPKEDRAKYLADKNKARLFAVSRIEYFNKIYNFSYEKINIKNPRTRWGSCSKKGNLNFNYKILHLPPKLADYIIVHELCHLKEFNHSPRFWNLVSQTIPNYKKCRKDLRKEFEFSPCSS